jgi:hypothetical protein
MTTATDTTSTITTTTADSAEGRADGEDEFSRLWGKLWSAAADVESGAYLAVLAQTDHDGTLNLRCGGYLAAGYLRMNMHNMQSRWLTAVFVFPFFSDSSMDC